MWTRSLLVAVTLLSACVNAAPLVSTAAPTVPAFVQPASLDAAARARVEDRVKQQVRALEPEFWQRRSKEGEAAANDWLTSQAMAVKDREMAKERRSVTQN